MTATQIIAIALMAIFYSAYLGKKFAQRKKGITTNQIGQGDKPRQVILIEKIMGIATLLIIPVELGSIILFPRLTTATTLPIALQWVGLSLTAVGITFFIIAMLTMADNWRAGIPHRDRTAFVSHGIYRISRNPAFIGFDLMYLGILIAFPNPIHLIFAAFPIVMLHLQIKQEEAYCQQTFGNEYTDYCTKVRRYL